MVVVETDPDLTRLIREALEGAYRVRTTADVGEAIHLCWTIGADLIITDVPLPGPDGRQLVAAVRADRMLAGVPILALSALGDDANRLELLLAGVNDYLVKPFSLVELRLRVANLVELRRAEQRRRDLSLLSERARIAAELHDVVIQRLFATGLRLQAASEREDGGNAPPAVVADTLRHIDDIIDQIRRIMLGLRTGGDEPSRRASALIAELAADLRAEPVVEISAGLDDLAGTPAVANLLCVLEEALSNIRRHAGASTFEVIIDCSQDGVALTVGDDGYGARDVEARAGTGMHTMRQRAEALGGTFTIERSALGGIEIDWVAPVPPPADRPRQELP